MFKRFKLLLVTLVSVSILLHSSPAVLAVSSINTESIFLSPSFDPSKLTNGAILQHDPLVMVTDIVDKEDHVLICEYVGKATLRNEEMGFWKAVQVNKTTGKVVEYSTMLSVFPMDQLSPPDGTTGLDFGNRAPLDMVWAIGKPGDAEIIVKEYWDPLSESDPWSGFSDVPDNSPFSDHIRRLKEQNIIEGSGNGTFGPQEQLTRAAFTKMMVIAFDIPESTKKTTFTDTTGHWAEPYIQSAVDASIVQGKTVNSFEPESPLSREEAATIIWRYLASQGVSATQQNVELYVPGPAKEGIIVRLPDNTSPWAQDAVKNVIYYKLYGYGVGEYNGAYFFHSKGLTKREEAAAFIDLSMRLLQKQE
jgi:S-layer homology domain.